MNSSTFTPTFVRRPLLAAAIAAAVSLVDGALLAAAPADNAPVAANGRSDANDELPEIETPVTNTPRPFNPHDPIKGRRSRRAAGQLGLGAVASAKFFAEHQMVIINVKHANQLYLAETGDYPKSHEEFMEKIIKANGIPLPALEPEHEYIYVPEQPEVGLQIRLKQSELKQATNATEVMAKAPEMMPARNVCAPSSHLDGIAPACRARKSSRKCKLHCRSTPKWHANCVNR
jgi:hypothetical protein